MRRFARVSVAALLLVFAAPGLAQELRITPIIGGLPADSGLALGVELLKIRAAGPADLRLRAIGSARLYQHYELGVELPRIGTDRLFGELRGRYRNYPEEDFWGLGPATLRDARSNFRLEDTDTTAALGVRLWRELRVEATGGFRNVHTGPGRDDDVPSIEQLFDPAEVPGLASPPDYWHTGMLVEMDTRDMEPDPFSGGLYRFQSTHFGARNGAPFSFRNFDIDLRQFLRVEAAGRIAFRGHAVFNTPVAGQEVPFFLQAWAGGSDTVRGFRQYRFRGRNALVLNAEYRRELRASLDVIAFVDAGRVFSQPSDFGFKDLKTSGGIGARIKFGSRVFLGVDAAVSDEGTRIWFRGGHTF